MVRVFWTNYEVTKWCTFASKLFRMWCKFSGAIIKRIEVKPMQPYFFRLAFINYFITSICFPGSRIRFVRSPRIGKKWQEHRCNGRKQERVRTKSVPDENDRSNQEPAWLLSGRFLRHHSQTSDFHLRRTGTRVVDLWASKHWLGWLESEHWIPQIHGELITGTKCQVLTILCLMSLK